MHLFCIDVTWIQSAQIAFPRCVGCARVSRTDYCMPFWCFVRRTDLHFLHKKRAPINHGLIVHVSGSLFVLQIFFAIGRSQIEPYKRKYLLDFDGQGAIRHNKKFNCWKLKRKDIEIDIFYCKMVYNISL